MVQDVLIAEALQLRVTVSPRSTRVGSALISAVGVPGQVVTRTTGQLAGVVVALVALTSMRYVPLAVKVRVAVIPVPYEPPPSGELQEYGPVAALTGCAVYVTVCPIETADELTEQDTLELTVCGRTGISVHGPQLLASLDSATSPYQSAQKRTE